MSAKAAVIVAGIVIALPVAADNAALTTGGLPTMMTSHPTVKMAWEKVQITVHANYVDADCNFEFQNTGTACNVRMGFPDFGLFAYAMKMDRPKSMFTFYQSFVDGKRVATKLVLGKGPGEQWQTKQVRFEAGQSHLVREHYHTELLGVSANVVAGMVSYLLHTGSSWKGNIGDAVVAISFAEDSELQPPLVPVDGTTFKDPAEFEKAVGAKGGLVYLGQFKPTLDGLTLTYHRVNWKPSDKDDIMVAFRYPPKQLAKMKAAYDSKGGH